MLQRARQPHFVGVRRDNDINYGVAQQALDPAIAIERLGEHRMVSGVDAFTGGLEIMRSQLRARAISNSIQLLKILQGLRSLINPVSGWADDNDATHTLAKECDDRFLQAEVIFDGYKISRVLVSEHGSKNAFLLCVNTLITMSGVRYRDTTKIIVEESPKLGADRVLIYDDVWLLAQPDHARDAHHLIHHPRCRGISWFSWKPYLILDALKRCPDDAIFYIDGDTFPVGQRLDVLFETTAREGIMLFRSNGWNRQSVWCKIECFKAMGQSEPKYWDAPCGVARFMGFTKKHIPFLEEWYRYCLMLPCQTFDVDPKEVQRPGFREHRTEQAIMTNLAHKYGHRLYREACQAGDATDTEQERIDAALDRDLYPRLFTQLYGTSPGDPAQGSIYRNV